MADLPKKGQSTARFALKSPVMSDMINRFEEQKSGKKAQENLSVAEQAAPKNEPLPPPVMKEKSVSVERRIEPLENTERSTPDQNYITMRVRMRLTHKRRSQSEIFIADRNLKPDYLYRNAVRNITVTDDDFVAGDSWDDAGPVDNAPAYVVKIDADLFAKWSSKVDPFGTIKPGEICKSAICVAFDRELAKLIEGTSK